MGAAEPRTAFAAMPAVSTAASVLPAHCISSDEACGSSWGPRCAPWLDSLSGTISAVDLCGDCRDIENIPFFVPYLVDAACLAALRCRIHLETNMPPATRPAPTTAPVMLMPTTVPVLSELELLEFCAWLPAAVTADRCPAGMGATTTAAIGAAAGAKRRDGCAGGAEGGGGSSNVDGGGDSEGGVGGRGGEALGGSGGGGGGGALGEGGEGCGGGEYTIRGGGGAAPQRL